MPEPNCDITLTVYEPTQSSPQRRFSYYCTKSSSGWVVLQNGSIHPPSRSRVVRISVEGYPNPVVMAGLQVVASPTAFSAASEPWYVEPGLGVTVEPALPPAIESTVLTLTFTTGVRLFYRLAVRDASDPGAELHWDDPKIYNDGDE